MDIILNGKYTGDELVNGVEGVVRLFKERYQIPEFREVHLTVTLVDEAGQDVELVDNQPGKMVQAGFAKSAAGIYTKANALASVCRCHASAAGTPRPRQCHRPGRVSRTNWRAFIFK